MSTHIYEQVRIHVIGMGNTVEASNDVQYLRTVFDITYLPEKNLTVLEVKNPNNDTYSRIFGFINKNGLLSSFDRKVVVAGNYLTRKYYPFTIVTEYGYNGLIQDQESIQRLDQEIAKLQQEKLEIINRFLSYQPREIMTRKV